jgi:hypothetical protein
LSGYVAAKYHNTIKPLADDARSGDGGTGWGFVAARHPKIARDFGQAFGWRRFTRNDMKESKGSFYG